MSNAEQTTRGLDDRGRFGGADGAPALPVNARLNPECEPDNSPAAIARAYDHLRSANIQDARATFERVLERERDNKAALLGLGHTFRHLKQLENAEAQF